MPRWASAGHHLHAERRRLDDHRRLDGVQDLVPLHRLADVLDVVETTEIAARHARVGVVEPGREHQPVPGDLALAGDLDHLARHVDAGDVGVVVDVDAGVDVGLLGGEEQPLEAVDLLAVHIGNPARAVGDVVEPGVDDDLALRDRRP